MTDAQQPEPMHGIINRLQRIEGQVRGLQRMLEQGREGAEIITQVSAVLAATRRAAGAITDLYLRQCLDEATGPDHDEAIAKLRAVLEAFSRLD